MIVPPGLVIPDTDITILLKGVTSSSSHASAI